MKEYRPMNEYEEMFLEWLEEQRAKDGLVSVHHSTTDGDTSSQDFFKEANTMNEAEATVVDGKENFPRYVLPFPLK